MPSGGANQGNPMDNAEYDNKFNQYLRLSSFPVAVKFLESWEEVPPRTKRPKEHLGNRFTTCQAVSMARRYGWALALGREDSSCVLGAMALGLEKRLPHYTEGNLCIDLYTENLEAGRLSEESVPRLPEGKYVGVLVAPLHRAAFTPDSIVIYGNGAQIMRLGQAWLWKRGGTLTSEFQRQNRLCGSGHRPPHDGGTPDGRALHGGSYLRAGAGPRGGLFVSLHGDRGDTGRPRGHPQGGGGALPGDELAELLGRISALL